MKWLGYLYIFQGETNLKTPSLLQSLTLNIDEDIVEKYNFEQEEPSRTTGLSVIVLVQRLTGGSMREKRLC